VNITSLDVLNHKRLLDSARADPSAVSFQVRPVDVVSGMDAAKRPSFGSLDTLQLLSEVRHCAGRAGGGLGARAGRTIKTMDCASPAPGALQANCKHRRLILAVKRLVCDLL
jgi:hypothetical protein